MGLADTDTDNHGFGNCDASVPGWHLWLHLPQSPVSSCRISADVALLTGKKSIIYFMRCEIVWWWICCFETVKIIRKYVFL